METRLGVNVDHVATIRQARGTVYPDPIIAASHAERAGADQITVHLREDRRHIQDRDVEILRHNVQTRLNLEMAATAEMQRIALALRPETVTLVPEKREEQTTEGGLDAEALEGSLQDYCLALAEGGIAVSLFIDPDPRQVDAAIRLGVAAIEIHTGDYAEAPLGAERDLELKRVLDAAKHASSSDLMIAAGHGLDYENVTAIASCELIEELNIGHSIVARSMFVGFESAVREMVRLMAEAGDSR